MAAVTEGGRGGPRSGPRSGDWEEEGCAESYTCARARARASVCDSIGAVVAVRLVVGACWCAVLLLLLLLLVVRTVEWPERSGPECVSRLVNPVGVAR